MSTAVRFWFDPVCPFAWLASRWIHEVATRRDLEVEWRLVSLRLLNDDESYDDFPAGYERGHRTGLELLRVAAAARDAHGTERLGALYTALGERIWEVDQPRSRSAHLASVRSDETLRAVLAEAGLPAELAAAADDEAWDVDVQADTDLALSTTGDDVGTPIIQPDAPDGPGFFGPVISAVPRGAQAVELWDHLLALMAFDGFAEVKRSLRARPQLRATGWTPDDEPVEEDWQAGARAADRPSNAH